MRRQTQRLFCWMALGPGLWLAVAPAAPAHAQDIPNHVILPPHWGATPLSTVIDAQSNLVAAQGDWLESAAVARKINAQAYALEAQNAFEDVKGYFELRRINREKVHEEQGNRPDLIRQRRQKAMESFIKKDIHDLLNQADVSRQLNWLLAELCGPGMSVQYVGSEALPELTQRLSEQAKSQIWLTDGGPAGRRLEFNLSEGKVLQSPWPPGLRREQFDPLRTEFEAARDDLLKEVQTNGRVSEATRNRLILAINQLLVTLEEVFPPDDRSEASVFLEYHLAKQYLRSLVGQVNRAISTNDRSIFTDAHRFQGSTLLDLIQYMYQSGLRFAPPKEGGEGIYKGLVQSLRNIYINLPAVRPAAAANRAETK